ncbi:MAG: 2-alkenal reductase, partial [Luteolibacter sp.]
KIESLSQLYKILYEDEAPEYHIIELHGASRPVVIRSADVAAANQRIAENYGIREPANLIE